MFKENKNKVLTMENDGLKTSVEIPWDAGMREILTAVHAICIGMAFPEECFWVGMRNFVEEDDPEDVVWQPRNKEGEEYAPGDPQ